MTIQATGTEIMSGWHLDKRVNLSHLVTTFTVTIGVTVWLLTLQERVKVVEVTQAAIVKSQDGVREDIRDLKHELVNKLDTMAERQYIHVKDHTDSGN